MKEMCYEGLIEKWKVDLIRSRAKQMGFYECDIFHIQQNIILDLINFKFDKSKSNGAKETTVFIKIIDNQLKKICRTVARYRNRIDKYKEEKFHELNNNSSTSNKHNECVFDIEEVLKKLSNFQKNICLALKEGFSIYEISKKLGCSWHTINKSIYEIRKIFKAMGLDNYIYKK